MEILNFIAGVVAVSALTYLPWLIGDRVSKNDDTNLDVKDKWIIGFGIVFFTVCVSILIYQIGKGVMYLITNFL